MARPTARIFAAIRLPPEVEMHLDEHIDAVRSAHPELRWVPSSRWHLTLEFLGECGPHEVERQRTRWARRARRSRPMTLRLEGAGTFPKTWMARTLWVGVGGDLETWRRLAGYQQDAHVTLARARERRDLTGLVDELHGYAGPSWTANELALVQSFMRTAGDNGPRYEPLDIFPLGHETTPS